MRRKAIGTVPQRKEGESKLLGRASYVDDVTMPGMLYGATVRSPVAAGRIIGIELEPGVPWSEIVVVTAADIPGQNVVALIEGDQPYLADQIVRHAEEPVLLLAHADPEIVEMARRKVRLEIDASEAALTVAAALAAPPIMPSRGASNVMKEIWIKKGDVDAAWASAAHVVEGDYATQAQEHLYIETNGMIATFDPAQGVTVWGSLQCPYYVHKALKALFALPSDKIRVVQLETGGGFGGKEEYPSMIAGHAALLARKAKRPVKLVYDRAEDMVATTKRHPSTTRHRTAFDADGKLLAMDVDFVLDGGAYVTLSPVVLSRGAIHAAGPYACPNVRIRARAVATNTPPHGAFRGFGAPQSIFAVERQMDKAAARLGLAPEELRQRNFLTPGSTTATSQEIRERADLPGLTRRALALSDFTAKRARFTRDNKTAPKGKKRGIGLATFMHGAGFTGSGERYLASRAAIEAGPDGTVRVLAASTEIGQGTNTVFAQIVADALGTDYARIDVVRPDTKVVPDSGPTVASRTVMVVGGLLERAAEQLRAKLVAAGALDAAATGEPAFAAACRTYHDQFGALRVETEYAPSPKIVWDDVNYRGDAYATFAWACYVAEVAVDIDTYEVEVTAFTAVQEAGTIVHPILAAGQIEGGVVQALGWALTEDVTWREGRMANARMTNYIIPTSLDAPHVAVEFYEAPGPYGPAGGAKGIGELPHDGAAPAVANAVAHALGIAPDELPISPERVLWWVAQRRANDPDGGAGDEPDDPAVAQVEGPHGP